MMMTLSKKRRVLVQNRLSIASRIVWKVWKVEKPGLLEAASDIHFFLLDLGYEDANCSD